jgi:hypothetical protein
MCNEDACPEATDCKGRWGAFSKCSAKCEGGTKKRRWHMIEREQGGGICPLRVGLDTTFHSSYFAVKTPFN